MTRARLAALALAAAVALVAAGPATALTLTDDDPAAVATPLAAAKPAWLTPALEAEVLAAGGTPVAAPADAPLPGEVGIRPGSWMVSPAWCTMNFVFTKSTKTKRTTSSSFAIGTAGHCAEQGDEVILLTVAPGGSNPVLVAAGSTITSRDNGIGDDFALVSIRPELHPWVSPTAAVVAGPCGSRSGSLGDPVLHYGHGVGVGTAGTPRAGISLYHEANAFYWDSASAPGDSGSFVTFANGLQAAGNLTHLVVDTRRPGAVVAGTTISKILTIAGGWSLASSPLC